MHQTRCHIDGGAYPNTNQDFRLNCKLHFTYNVQSSSTTQLSSRCHRNAYVQTWCSYRDAGSTGMMPKIAFLSPICRPNCCDILAARRYIRRAASYNNPVIISPKYRQLLLSPAFGTVLEWSASPVFVLHLMSTSLFSAVGNLYRKTAKQKEARKSVNPLQTWFETRAII